MKNTIFTCLLILGNITFAQNYVPMLGNTNEWNIVRLFEGTYTQKYYTKDTSTIKGELYHNVRLIPYKKVVAYLREDTTEKIVYTRVKVGDKISEEFILYDFSINKEDLIGLYNWEYGHGFVDSAGIFIVDSISTVNTLIDTRRIFYLTSTFKNDANFYIHVTWIEGIGTLGHFFSPGHRMRDWDNGLLSCFYKNGVHVFQSPDYETCEFSIGINNQNNSDVSLYPNPFKYTLTIENSGMTNGMLYIYNTMGQSVFQKPFSGLEKQEVDLSHLPKGMYIVKVSNGHKSYGEIVLKE